MSAAAHIRPTRMAAISFKAWRITGGGLNVPIEIEAETLADAVDAASARCLHKEWLAVLEDGARGRAVHYHVIKQGAPIWVRKPGFAHTVQMKPLKAVHQFSQNMGDYAPVEPWAWSPDCDPVGLTEARRSTVEARP